jgi:hypothetical protein
MSVAAISAASLSQEVLSTSNATQLQQALLNLQSNLSSGNLSGAQSAFATLQLVSQSLATASGNTSSGNSQYSTDLNTLGSALTAGDLTAANSAFATVQSDLKNSNSPLLANETSAASQAEQLVGNLLSTLNANSAPPSTPDNTTSILNAVYGTQNGINVLG